LLNTQQATAEAHEATLLTTSALQTMPQALEVVGPLLGEYWDEVAMLFLLAPYARNELHANHADVRLERLFGWPF
jgi:hypothetical protein